MTDLLETVIEAHGGLTRRTQLETVSARLIQGGALWALKGQQGVLDDVFVTQPFTFALPGFETAELDQWQEQGEQWRRLHVIWPSYLATHSTEQTLYFGQDGLIRRHDYDVEIMGGNPGAHYVSDYTQVAGIMLPTKHRVFPRAADGQALSEPLIVSIDVSEVAFA